MFTLSSMALSSSYIFKIDLLLLLFILSFNSSYTLKDVQAPEALRIAPPPMTFDDVSSKCWNFTHGNYQKMEFYSPGFPLKYTNDTDCVLYLEAPKGFIIQLDFRETFKIENSENCKYDFLEVRDGPFAYSPLMKRYCGSSFPPLLTSSSRHLWLRFKSDDLIQDDGFRAIYSYIKQPTQSDGVSLGRLPLVAPACRRYLEVSPSQPDGILTSTHFPSLPSHQAPRPFDCTWEIHTATEFGIYVRSYNVTMHHGQRCDENYVALYKRTTLDKTKYVQHCAVSQVEMKTRQNRVFVRIYGKTPALRPELNLIYTIYKKDVAICNEEEFSCAGMCLPMVLLCNGVPNCPNNQDEDSCFDKSVSSVVSNIPLHTIVAGSIGGVVCTLFIIGACLTCYKRRRNSQKQKAEKAKLQERRLREKETYSPSVTTQCFSSPNQQHTQLTTQNNDYTHRYSFGSTTQQSSDGDHDILTDLGNYKRLLGLEASQDEESSPCPSLSNQTGVLCERYPALESQHYPRFAATNWRKDDNCSYASLKKNNHFVGPYCGVAEKNYSNSLSAQNDIGTGESL